MKSHTLNDRLTGAPLKAVSRNAVIALALLVATAQLASAVPTITATQDDGVPAATRKLLGQTVNYTTIISNTGTDATGVTLTNATPLNTTDVGVVGISPITFDDIYPQSVIGNVSIDSANIPYSVLTNDFLGQGGASRVASSGEEAN